MTGTLAGGISSALTAITTSKTPVSPKTNVAADKAKTASGANVTFSKSKVESFTKNATHNNSSKSVTLGKWENGEGSYLSVAKKNGDTYFDLGTEGWDKTSELVNGNMDEMWKIKWVQNNKEWRLLECFQIIRWTISKI